MKIFSILIALALLSGCSHSQSIHRRTTAAIKKQPVKKAEKKAPVLPQKESEIDSRLESLKKELDEMNKAVAKNAEKAGKNFRKKLDKLWKEQDVLSKAWDKTREKSGEALSSVKEHTGDGVEAGLESMEKALNSLREKLK